MKSDDCFTLKSNGSLCFQTSSLPVEANNTKSVPFRPAYSTVESFFCPLMTNNSCFPKNISLIVTFTGEITESAGRF